MGSLMASPLRLGFGVPPDGERVRGDPVTDWKHDVVAAIAEQARYGRTGKRIRLRVTLGFALAAALLGASRGLPGVLGTLLLCASVFLVHEGARALFVLARGRSARVTIAA